MQKPNQTISLFILLDFFLFFFFFSVCGAALTASTGEILSPSYPNQYPLNAACQWTLPPPTPNTTTTILLDTPDFQLASSHTLTVTSANKVCSIFFLPFRHYFVHLSG
jgi:hypothetical protein